VHLGPLSDLGPLSEGVSLAEHTSFGIGGPAALFIEAGTAAELSRILAAADEEGIETLVLGGGTNLLVSDEGYDGLVVKLELGGLEIDRARGEVTVGAGVPTAELVSRLVEEGLGGLQFASGLPGTVGGAIAGNAGCFGHSLSDRLVRARVVEPTGRERAIDDPGWFGFDYRFSALRTMGAVLVEATFALEEGERRALEAAAAGYLEVRASKHPARAVRTAGSYFKNLEPLEPGGRRRAAGALLDQAGAHGLAVGDAAVFERHANIIVNRGAARARDVLALAAKMKRLVAERFGETLEEEVRFIGARPEGI
jgi:UDP-N-acetylmuramate dehydrogenase